MNETKILNCQNCDLQPDIFEHLEAGLKIGCTKCGKTITETDDAITAIEYWNLINMDYDVIIHYAADRMKEQSEAFLQMARENYSKYKEDSQWQSLTMRS